MKAMLMIKWEPVPLSFMLVIVLLLHRLATGLSAKTFSRSDFPPKPSFVFGSGTSAYQVEGAANEDGRTPSIFDTFVNDESWHGGNGEVACDGYHKYKEDVKLMVDTGLDAYRFSISWSRLIPNGRGPVNPKGFEYYNNLINELVKHGIEPHVTLFHFDLPQILEDEYKGFLSRRIVKDFVGYADVCFKEFGDRVSQWLTFNEGNIFVLGGYDFGQTPPKRCSDPFGFNCTVGNSTIEPYIAAHNMMIAHATAVKLYRKKYQAKQGGSVGVNLYSFSPYPATNSTEDVLAASRANEFFIGWFMNPLTYGDYPKLMKKNAGSRLPSFSKGESELLKGSYDFVGVNLYTSVTVKDNPNSLERELRDLFADMAVTFIFTQEDFTQGYPILPGGMQATLEYFKQAYGNPPIYIHENGQISRRNKTLNDTSRVEYLQAYIGSVLDAIRNGSNARGYFNWSFLDVYELLDGWTSCFGLYYVDLDDPNLTRYPKLSQRWYSAFLKGHENVTISERSTLAPDHSVFPLRSSQ